MTVAIKPRKYKLSRLLGKNDVRVVPTMEEDLKWFWAAYKKGGFDDFLEEDLSQKEFVNKITTLIEGLEALYTIFYKDRAVGTVLVIDRLFMLEHYQEPHISWFPWAEGKDKVRGAVKMVLELRKNGPVFIQVHKEQAKFVTHVAKYGILRRIGKLDQHGQEIFLYEAMRSK